MEKHHRKQALFPDRALSLILLFDFIFIPGFFSIENRDGNLHGSLIDILRNGSTVMCWRSA